MSVLALLLFIAGLVLLVGGAEVLVRGSVRLAALVGMSSLVIGLTVVAYGTSLPELAVSVQSGLAGRADVGLGNAVGSNIMNILLVLGLSAVVAAMPVSKRLYQFDLPAMAGSFVLVWVLSLDGALGMWDGVILVAGGLLYTGCRVSLGRRDDALAQELDEEYSETGGKPVRPVFFYVGMVLCGLVLIVVGADWLVDGAVSMARALGLSELVIGLTVVAVGTSLPELATSVVASVHGHRDLAVGNIVGSCFFNIAFVLGIAGWVVPGGLAVSSIALRVDIPVMILVGFICFPIFRSGWRIGRLEGGFFLLCYLVYVAYLVFGTSFASI
ncbi:MAG: calcium/sodium antiporter [Candidatus Omnitrophica bacterium]|nr:calcium/sodium antiporter [Candidatus Omnitrophota bacterium]